MYRVKEAAAKLGCSASNVYALLARGEFVKTRVGLKKGYRITEESLRAFLHQRSEGPGGTPARSAVVIHPADDDEWP